MNIKYQILKVKNSKGKYLPKWKMRFFDVNGKYMGQETGFTDKRETIKFAEKRVRELEEELLNPYLPKLSNRPIEELFREYISIESKNGGRGGYPWSKRHQNDVTTNLFWWKSEISLNLLGDITLAKVEAKLSSLVGKVVNKTLNMKAASLKTFLNWCVKHNYIVSNPLNPLRKYQEKVKNPRRALSLSEIKFLLESVSPEKYLAYKMALLTGMRNSELASLTVGAIDWDLNLVTLKPEHAKNRKRFEFSLPKDFIIELYRATKGKPGKAKLLEGLSQNHAGELLRSDMKAAGLETNNSEGKIDFHSLRVTFITHMARLGTDIKTLQEIARHSDINMTMNVYAKTNPELRAGAINALNEAVAGDLCHIRNTAPTNPRIFRILRNKPLGVTGFEPAASSSRTMHSTS